MNRLMIKDIDEAIENGDKVALVTLTKASGSAPRKEGTMMVVHKDSTIVGTIGGGMVEFEVIKKAVECIKEGRDFYFKFDLGEGGDLGMACGGNVEGFIKVISKEPQLIICGGGHVGHNIFKLAKNLSFNRILIDDRIEFSNQVYKENGQVIVGDYKEEISKISIDEPTYIVIATKGHDSDLQVLREVINSKANYIGLIGSRRKIIKLKEILMNEGISEEVFERIYAPIGLDISDGTPEEIALAIIAEILTVKNTGSLKHCRD